jgi:hypothetical protein
VHACCYASSVARRLLPRSFHCGIILLSLRACYTLLLVYSLDGAHFIGWVGYAFYELALQCAVTRKLQISEAHSLVTTTCNPQHFECLCFLMGRWECNAMEINKNVPQLECLVEWNPNYGTYLWLNLTKLKLDGAIVNNLYQRSTCPGNINKPIKISCLL